MERRAAAAAQTRDRVTAAVRELLAEGAFHDASVEDVAKRAGVGRATIYEHFGSRAGVIDAVCGTLEASPAMKALRAAAVLPDPVDALRGTVQASTGFWASEEPMFAQLTALAASHDGARAWRDRQRADRRRVCAALVERLDAAGALRMKPADALAHLLVATSFEAFAELRDHAGLSLRATAAAVLRVGEGVM